MRATVLVEKIGKRKFRATTSHPVVLETEGESQEEALERLRELATKRLAAGKLFDVRLTDTADANPWTAFAGIWKDHPDFPAFQKSVAEYRRTVNRQGLEG